MLPSNTSINESMIEGEQKVELILHRIKGAHIDCDLNTARMFTNQFRQRLDAVFERFIENTNFGEKSHLNLNVVGSSTINPANIIIVDNDSDEEESDINSETDYDDISSDCNTVWIIDSDNENSGSVAIKGNTNILSRKKRTQNRNDSKLSKMPTRFSLRQRTMEHRHFACFACGLHQKNSSPQKCNAKNLNKPKKWEQKMQTFSDKSGKKTKHESKCKLRFECYLCGKKLCDLSQCKKHLQRHIKPNKGSRKL